MKVDTRNNLLTKLGNSKWGANPSTIRMTALALSYSTAEYAAPVWARSHHAKTLDPGLNQACWYATGCLKPTNVEDLYFPSGIAPPAIRREMYVLDWRQKQSTREMMMNVLEQCNNTKLTAYNGTIIPHYGTITLTWLTMVRPCFLCGKHPIHHLAPELPVTMTHYATLWSSFDQRGDNKHSRSNKKLSQ